MNKVTIVNYHYVREIKNSPYPNLKGLEFKSFQKQLDFLEKKYNIIDPDDLYDHKKLKLESCLLTFDDGLKDHIKFVLPELKKRRYKACFFPPAKPIETNIPLSTHLIHFILEKTKDFKKLNQSLFNILKEENFSNKEIEDLWAKYSHKNNFDNEDVSFFKRILQKVLPFDMGNMITKKIFEERFNKSVQEISKELYLSKEDLIEIKKHGMTIGSHTYNHVWLETLNIKDQEKELDLSLKFLDTIGINTKSNWMMCYPFGSFNDDTISLLKKKNCSYAFTTISGVANISDQYKLKRIDTNEFPK